MAIENNTAGSRNVILVHGILTDGSVWRKVIPLLQQQGIEVTAAQLQNATLEDDIGTVRRTLDIQDGPTLLVGHSYGGMVISGIGKHEKVTGLVYIAALVPDENETVSYLMAKEPTGYAMEPLSDKAGFMWPPGDAFSTGFAQDSDPTDLGLLWATRRSFGGILFSSTIYDPAWKKKPSWYLVAKEDRALHPDTQRWMAQRAGARIEEAASGHLAQITQPEAVVKLILGALRGD